MEVVGAVERVAAAWDEALGQWLNHSPLGLGGPLQPVWEAAAISWVGGVLLMGAVVAALSLARRSHTLSQRTPPGWRTPLLAALLAFGIADPLVSRVLKPWADRPRPCATVGEAPGGREHAAEQAWRVAAVGCGSGRAMPSGHAANSAAVAVALGSPVAVPALSVVYAVAGLAGLSRIVAGQHYPSDVLAGWLVGGGIGWCARQVARWVARWIVRWVGSRIGRVT